MRSRERIERLAAAEGLGLRGPVAFCAATLSESPDYGALFATIRAAYRERQEEIERDAALMRAAQEREERRLSNRLRRTVRGF